MTPAQATAVAATPDYLRAWRAANREHVNAYKRRRYLKSRGTGVRMRKATARNLLGVVAMTPTQARAVAAMQQRGYDLCPPPPRGTPHAELAKNKVILRHGTHGPGQGEHLVVRPDGTIRSGNIKHGYRQL